MADGQILLQHIPVPVVKPGAFDTGSNLVIDAVAEQLTTASVPCRMGVLVKADDENTGSLFLGNSSAVTAGTVEATDGFRLQPGDAVFLPVASVGAVWVIGSAAGQKAWFIAV